MKLRRAAGARLRYPPLAIALFSAPAAAQKLGQGDDVDISIARLSAALLVILVLAALALYFGRARLTRLRFWTGAQAHRLTVLEVVRIAPGATLCLASLDDREFLVAVTPQGATVIEPGKASTT